MDYRQQHKKNDVPFFYNDIISETYDVIMDYSKFNFELFNIQTCENYTVYHKIFKSETIFFQHHFTGCQLILLKSSKLLVFG